MFWGPYILQSMKSENSSDDICLFLLDLITLCGAPIFSVYYMVGKNLRHGKPTFRWIQWKVYTRIIYSVQDYLTADSIEKG